MAEKSEQFQFSREAAKITLGKISSWEELNAATLEEADKKFNEKIKETWKEFAVHGVLVFDPKEGRQVLKPFTDLDGKSALGILKLAGIDTSKLTYVRPGESIGGSINLDTGDKIGVVYDQETGTSYFDHHAKDAKEITSATKIMYETMIDLGKLKKTENMDKLVDFVTKLDNFKYPPENFLKSHKTILGLQRDLDFDKLAEYFKEHQSPTEELTPEQFEKYGLKEASEKQQKLVEESTQTMDKMEKEGKVIDTSYGRILINEKNELKIGAPAAYTRYDGIINYIPNISFAVMFKNKDINEKLLKEKLGDKFQGKVIRGKMWIYNNNEPLKLNLEEIKYILTERMESDRRLVDGGAQWKKIKKWGLWNVGKRLQLTPEQIETIRNEMEEDLESRPEINEKEKQLFRETVKNIANFFTLQNLDYQIVGGLSIDLLAENLNLGPWLKKPKDIDVIIFSQEASQKLINSGYKLTSGTWTPIYEAIQGYNYYHTNDLKNNIPIDLFITKSSLLATSENKPFVISIDEVPIKLASPIDSYLMIKSIIEDWKIKGINPRTSDLRRIKKLHKILKHLKINIPE